MYDPDMARKKGRPPGKSKPKQVMIRFSIEDYEAHKAEAEADGRNLCDHIRQRLRTHPDFRRAKK
jgi:predicted HicB family RNase H-like nuclease